MRPRMEASGSARRLAHWANGKFSSISLNAKLEAIAADRDGAIWITRLHMDIARKIWAPLLEAAAEIQAPAGIKTNS